MKTFPIVTIIIVNFNVVLSIVKIDDGEIEGTTYTLPNGRIIHAFLGVPYAAPPILENRFKEPQILEPWNGIWNATTPLSCLQIGRPPHYDSISGEEDCLHMNIYTPKLPKNGVNPLMNVFVQMHGGAFTRGAGTDMFPDLILQDDNIVHITINHRLGVLGFFSSGDTMAPGNFGMKDQIAALKWVQRNIIKFGGNPQSVTFAGVSSGADSVHLHYMSPLSEGLFQKGISFSGSALRPTALPENIVQKSIQLSVLIGCPTNDSAIMVKCLRSRPANQLVATSRYFFRGMYGPRTVFGPVIEPEHSNAFLSSSPLQLMKNGEIRNLPWMVNFVANEGLNPGASFISNETLLKELDEKWYEVAPILLVYNDIESDTVKNNISSTIRKFYFGEKTISKDTSNEVVQMIGDRMYTVYNLFSIKLHDMMVAENEIYCYNFKYRGKYSFTNIYTKDLTYYGICHVDDLFYISYYFEGLNFQETESDKNLSKLMISIVTDFMETGNPASRFPHWEPISKNENDNVRCLSIYSPTHQIMEDVFNSTVVKFWRNLLPAK